MRNTSAVALVCACLSVLGIACTQEHKTSSLPGTAEACAEPLVGSLRVVRDLALSEAGVDEPEAIQADGRGGVWVLDPSSKVVAHFDRDGALRATVSRIGPAPWELSAPQAIGADSAAGVWISDASRARVVHFSADGTFIEAVSTPAAISATGIARAGSRLYLSQHMMGGTGTARAFVRTAAVGSDTAPGMLIDSLTPARLAAAPFYGAPMVESLVAVRPGGGIVITYPLAYRLRFFDDAGRLEHEVFGCEGANSNARSLKSASMERGMSFKPFVSVLQYDTSGTLTVVLTTPQHGYHRVDEYDRSGKRIRSMRLPSRSTGGVLLTGVVPGSSPGLFWALDRITSRVRLIDLTWPSGDEASSR